MACYTSRTYKERKQIQELREAGAQAKEIAEKLAALTAEAKELGATSKFTAQQSGNAMEYVAMAD